MTAQQETGSEPSYRVDRVQDLPAYEAGIEPVIVHLSDVHGYLDSARSALLAVGDVDEFEPFVEVDETGTLHWTGGEEFVLVINGDVIDRGPANEECLELVWRLQREAPPGHVRYHIGNHEMAMLLPEVVSWSMWYSGQQPRSVREEFYERILDGRLGVAFAGYEYTYSHAGSPEPFDVSAVNDALEEVAQKLLSTDGSERGDLQHDLVGRYPTIFGIGDGGRGPGAGLLWLDFTHLPNDAPPQVVGHTRQLRPTRKGNVICGNVIRHNRELHGGDGVVVETPGRIGTVVRNRDESASCTFFSETD